MKSIISQLNKAFESRIKLGIMSVLVVNDYVDFNTLKELLQTSDGNLASHLRVLEKGELIEVNKQFVGRKPKTTYKATPLGKKLFKQHIQALEALIRKK
ncbi:MAG: transcriptional regulator [Chlorobi bacterium]|nr:transcriptional regulator [Chlorobiota bacterium]